jgi:hypothetical protein
VALADNLTAYWSCDEASGNLLDSHGGNDLTDNNTVGSGTGKVSGGRDFEADSSEYFSIADNADLSTGDIDFTLQAWVQLESKGSVRVIVGKWPAVGNFEYLLYYDSGADRFTAVVSSNGSNVISVVANNLGSPSTGTWYLIHFWHDSVNNLIGISANAGAADTTAHSGGVRDGNGPLNVGRNDDGDTHFWDGLIDEIGFWKRVLTSDERTELYNGGSGRDYAYITGGAAPTNATRLLGGKLTDPILINGALTR